MGPALLVCLRFHPCWRRIRVSDLDEFISVSVVPCQFFDISPWNIDYGSILETKNEWHSLDVIFTTIIIIEEMSPSLELAQTMDNFRKRSKNETNDDIDIYFNETRRMTI